MMTMASRFHEQKTLACTAEARIGTFGISRGALEIRDCTRSRGKIGVIESRAMHERDGTLGKGESLRLGIDGSASKP